MDLVSMAASIMAAKAGALQQQVATSTLKSNLDAQKSTVLTLLGAGQQAPSPMSAPASVAISTSARRRRQPLGLHRGRDQLDRVVAVPLCGSGDGCDLAALGVDKHGGGHPERPPY